MPNVSMIPGVYAERAQVARQAGRLVMQMLERGGPLPREIVTRKVAGKRRGHRRRHRRIDQRRAASAGARQRGRHILHDRRCRRGVCAHAADRQFASGRKIHRQGCLRHRRRRRRDPRAGRKRSYRRQLPDDHGQDDRGRIWRRECARRRGHLSDQRADHAGRRRRGAEGQSLPRWRRHQGRGPEEPGVRRHRARVRGRGDIASMPCATANTQPAKFSSSATKVRSAAPACARCSASPR